MHNPYLYLLITLAASSQCHSHRDPRDPQSSAHHARMQANPLYSNFGKRPDSANTTAASAERPAQPSSSRMVPHSPLPNNGSRSGGRIRRPPVKRRRADTPDTESDDWEEQSTDTEV